MLGAIIGDIVGSIYEFNNIHTKEFELIKNKSHFTDDTILTIAVIDILINNKDIVKTLKEYGKKYPSSYGLSFASWIYDNNNDPYYSYGNGAAMRISPVGFLANSEQQVKEWSKKITEVTHDHPEGLKGAEVTAMCIYKALHGAAKEDIKKYASHYYKIDKSIIKNYRFNETCQNTVPQAIYCFLISKDFEDCIRTCISIGGDSDTLAAIAGGIAEAYYKNVSNINVNDKLPLKFKELLNKAYTNSGLDYAITKLSI